VECDVIHHARLRVTAVIMGYYAPPLIGGGIKQWCCLTSDVWRLSRTSCLIWEQRGYRKIKIGTEVAHVTHVSNTTFKVKRSKVKVSRRLTHPRVGASGHGNVLAVGNCCYVAVCSAARGALAPTGEGEGRGISWRPPTYSLFELTLQFITNW